MLKIQAKSIIHLFFLGTMLITHSSCMDQCNEKIIFPKNQQKSAPKEVLKKVEGMIPLKNNFAKYSGMLIQKGPQNSVPEQNENSQFLLDIQSSLVTQFSWESDLVTTCIFPVISSLPNEKTQWLFNQLSPFIKAGQWDEEEVSSVIKIVSPIEEKKTQKILNALFPFVSKFNWHSCQIMRHFKAFSQISTDKIKTTAQVLESQLRKKKWYCSENFVPIIASMTGAKKAEPLFDIVTFMIQKNLCNDFTAPVLFERFARYEVSDIERFLKMITPFTAIKTFISYKPCGMADLFESIVCVENKKAGKIIEILTPFVTQKKWKDCKVAEFIPIFLTLKIDQKIDTIFKILFFPITEYNWQVQELTKLIAALIPLNIFQIQCFTQVFLPIIKEMRGYNWNPTHIASLITGISLLQLDNEKIEGIFNILTPLIIKRKFTPEHTAYFMTTNFMGDIERLGTLVELVLSCEVCRSFGVCCEHVSNAQKLLYEDAK